MSEEIRTFDGAIERLKDWSKFRFEDSSARALIDHCLAIHRAPNVAPDLWRLWEDFRYEGQLQIREQLDGNDWSRTEGHALVLLLKGSIETRNGIRHFLPSKVSLGDEEKQLLWAWYLLLLAVFGKLKDPYHYLRPSTIFFMSGPYVEREMVARRMKYSDDFSGGMIAYCQRTGDDRLPGAADLISTAANSIARSARKRLSAEARKLFSEGSATSVSTILEAQVQKTLFAGFSGIPEEIVARALDGNLKVATAVAHDVLDEQRFNIPGPVRGLLKKAGELKRRAKKERRESTAEEKRRLQEIDNEVDMITRQIDQVTMNPDFAIERLTPEDIVVGRETERRRSEFAEKHPDKWALIETVILDGVPQKEVALQEGVSPSAITQRLQTALNALYEFLKN